MEKRLGGGDFVDLVWTNREAPLDLVHCQVISFYLSVILGHYPSLLGYSFFFSFSLIFSFFSLGLYLGRVFIKVITCFEPNITGTTYVRKATKKKLTLYI